MDENSSGAKARANVRNITLLGLTSLLTDVSTEMAYPLLPLFLTSGLGAGPALVGLIEGLAESVASLLKVLSGHVSDRLRRRKGLALAGYSASTLGKVALYASASWVGVLTGRLVDRFGKGVRTAPRDALIAESAPAGRQGWAFGLHRAMDTMGATAGAFAAYLFLVRSTGAPADVYRSVFLVAIIPGLLGVVALLAVRDTGSFSENPARTAGEARAAGGVRTAGPAGGTASSPGDACAESRQDRPPGLPPARFLGNLDPGLKALLVATGVFTLGNSSNQFILLRAAQAAGPEHAVLLYVWFNLVYSLLSWPAGLASDRLGRRRVLVAGFILYAVVYAALAAGLETVPWGYGVVFTIYGVYSALTDGVAKALVADLAPREARATVMGLHATIVGLGLFPASLVAGLLWSARGPSVAFGLGAAAGIAAAAILAWSSPRCAAAGPSRRD